MKTPPGPNTRTQVGVLSRFVLLLTVPNLLPVLLVSLSHQISACPFHPPSPSSTSSTTTISAPNMSLVAVTKPQHASFSPIPLSHRRHPSAPVVVQPTRTPGLLSIKPQKQSPARQLPAVQRQQRSAARPAKSTQLVRAPVMELPDRKLDVAHPSTPMPSSRGRSQAKAAKDKIQAHRNESNHRTKHGRQPSPPITTQVQSQINQPPSQAEVSVISANLFDPFLDNNMVSPPPSPSLSRPSGKLARRRQQQSADSLVSPSPAKSMAIPVPGVNRIQYPSLSRSDPVPSHMQHPRQVPRRSSTFQEFPICDDSSEMADEYPPSPPATPSRPTGAPRTARMSAPAPFGFPFAKMETPSPPRANAAKAGKRNHRRVPSEGVFNMSSDEDVSSSGLSQTPLRPASMSKATSPSVFSTPYTRLPRSREPLPFFAPMSKEQQLERDASEKAGYFASSMFQNSPSPEELPDPLLL